MRSTENSGAIAAFKSAARGTLGSMAVLVALLTTGCARYYSTDVAGYVKDAATGAGVVGATVRIYLSKPAAATADGYVAETTTTYFNTIPGFYDRKIMWQTDTPKFSEEGDTIPVWIGVSGNDFAPVVAEVQGVLSGSQQDFMPDVVVSRTAFYATITGQVGYISAAGPPPVFSTGPTFNNSRVSLDFNIADTSEPAIEPYVSYTSQATANGTVMQSVFTIPNIRWTNGSPPSTGIDNPRVLLWVTPSGPSGHSGTTSFLVTIYSNPIANSFALAVP